jgi:coenzyme PQQ precursor peptide PqqA
LSQVASKQHDLLLRRNISMQSPGKRFHWRTFLSAVVYPGGRSSSGSKRRAIMAWKAPKIVEVPVGMEINMYACAARK